MLPLAATDLPTSLEALADALESGLKKHGITAKGVKVSGGTYPAVNELTLDLTGATVTRETRLPVAKANRDDGVTVAHFSLKAAPLRLEKTPVRLTLEAHDTRLKFGQDEKKQAALVLTAAGKGEVEVQVQRGDVEELIRSMAAEAAAEHGVDIKDVRLAVATQGPRAVSFRAEVKAKMFVMSATITVSGEATIDDQLNARVSNLKCSGDGMIGNLASGFIKPYFDKIERNPIALMALPLGPVKLRDISLEAGEALTLSAKFSS
jgi:hypothetical protein